MTVGDWLTHAKRQIATLDAEVLGAHSLGLQRSQLLAHPELTVPSVADEYLNRRVAGEPVAYIVGSKEFYGRVFLVTRDVLIPRPETECLVEAVLETGVSGSVLDLGTGSGAIAVTLKLERPDLSMAASDLSPSAIDVAARNSRRLGAEVAFVAADRLSAVGHGLDAIVCNPPYVVPGDSRLEPEVSDWEPPQALYAERGISFIVDLVNDARGVLKPGGLLAFEFGVEQDSAVAELLADWNAVEIRADLSGVPRVALGRCPS